MIQENHKFKIRGKGTKMGLIIHLFMSKRNAKIIFKIPASQTLLSDAHSNKHYFTGTGELLQIYHSFNGINIIKNHH